MQDQIMDDSSSELPIELWEAILSLLHNDREFITLHTCSLINRMLCQLAQRIILRKILLPERDTFLDDELSPPPARLLNVLNYSLRIAAYVKVLTIESTWQESGVNLWELNTPLWLTNPKSNFSLILPVFPKLQKLAIVGRKPQIPKRNCYPRHWGLFSADFQIAIARSLSTHSLTELDVTGIDLFPATILTQCSTLTSLLVTSISPDDSPVPSLDVDYAPPAVLKYVHFEDMGQMEVIWPWFKASRAFDIRRLQHLSVFMDSAPIFDSVISQSRWNYLTHLSLVTDTKILTKYNTLNFILAEHRMPIPNLEEFTVLDTLTIDAVFHLRTSLHRTLVDFYVTPVPWIADLLKSFSKTSNMAKLSRLNLKLSFYNFTDQLPVINLLDWKVLTRELMPPQFPGLLAVELSLKGLGAMELDRVCRDEHLKILNTLGLLIVNDES